MLTEPTESVWARAEWLFEHGQDDELLALAASNWPGQGVPLTADHAELARFARIVAYRQCKSSPGSSRALIDLWQARAIAAACTARALRSAALSLQPHFLRFMDTRDFDEARAVLGEMSLIESRNSLGPRPRLLLGEYAERMAFHLSKKVLWRWDRLAQRQHIAPRHPSCAELKVGVRAIWLAGGSAGRQQGRLCGHSSQYPDAPATARRTYRRRATTTRTTAARSTWPNRWYGRLLRSRRRRCRLTVVGFSGGGFDVRVEMRSTTEPETHHGA
jgi:hypothetical protein